MQKPSGLIFARASYEQIERWWEVVSSAYLMVSLQFNGLDGDGNQNNSSHQSVLLNHFSQHPWWNEIIGWKHRLNNLQLITQPYIYFCFLKPWLKVFEIPQLRIGFSRLISIMNEFAGWLPVEAHGAGYYVSQENKKSRNIRCLE